jgi:hypothetical protein
MNYISVTSKPQAMSFRDEGNSVICSAQLHKGGSVSKVE